MRNDLKFLFYIIDQTFNALCGVIQIQAKRKKARTKQDTSEMKARRNLITSRFSLFAFRFSVPAEFQEPFLRLYWISTLLIFVDQ